MESTTEDKQVDRAAARLGEIQRAVAEVVVGQERLVESVLVALLCRGHVLLEGVPGIAKTLTVRTLAGYGSMLAPTADYFSDRAMWGLAQVVRIPRARIDSREPQR